MGALNWERENGFVSKIFTLVWYTRRKRVIGRFIA